MSKGTYMPAPSRARSIGPSSLSIFATRVLERLRLEHVGGKGLIASLSAASASSRSLGRAVAATVTPASASRCAISPQIAPERR